MAASTSEITHRRVLNIALPIVLSNATVPILGLVDTGVVGQLGAAAPIGAVGIGAIIITAFYWVFGFLRMGTTGFTSQAHGAGDRAEVTVLLTRAVLIGAACGVSLIALQLPLFWAGFWASPASPEVETLARDYMTVRIWSAPAAIALFGINGWLIALERTRAVFALQIWMNGVNILLDLLFVLHLGWGVSGVAFATFIAEWSGLALGLWFCRDVLAEKGWNDWPRVFDRARLIRMMKVNIDIMIRSLALMSIFVSFIFLSADFGDVTLATNQILMQFIETMAYALDGFAFAAETLVGQAVGAASIPRLRRGIWMCSVWSLVGCVVLSFVFLFFGGALVDVMAKVPDIQNTARIFLPYLVLVPLLGLPSWMLDGVFIGATRTRDMRNMSILSALAFGAVALVLVPAYGNHGLWIALLFSFVARGVSLGVKYPALERATAQPT